MEEKIKKVVPQSEYPTSMKSTPCRYFSRCTKNNLRPTLPPVQVSTPLYPFDVMDALWFPSTKLLVRDTRKKRSSVPSSGNWIEHNFFSTAKVQ